MKKIIIMFSAVLMAVSIAGCKKNENTALEKLPTVGIAKLLAHPALNSVEKGIQDELAAKGVKVNYDLQNANADMNIATSIANKFKSDSVNVTVGIGTPMAIALLNTLQNTPIVFAAISDPVAAHLVPSKEKKKIYHDCGQYYCVNVERFLQSGKVVMDNTKAVIMDEMEVQDIDNLADWKLAELKYKFMLDK